MSNKNLFKSYVFTVYIACLLTTGYAVSSEDAEISHLRKQGTATQLIVNGKPFLILGGELGNSSSSNLNYMKSHWSKLIKLYRYH